MKHSIYVLGAPGVGKSTLMAGLLANVAMGPVTTLRGTLRGHYFNGGVYLGIMRNRFPGTDGLAMNATTDAEAFVLSATDGLLIGEGSRLGHTRFLDKCNVGRDMTLIHLHASEDALCARRNHRGSDQNVIWMRGAATRARHAFDNARPHQRIDLDTSDLSAEQILSIITANLPEEVRKTLRLEQWMK